MTTPPIPAHPLLQRTHARNAEPGTRVRVFGFVCQHKESQRVDCGCRDQWVTGGMGRFHEGIVRLVEADSGDFLDTAVHFDDGRVVYARSYAVTVVLGEAVAPS